MASYYNTRYVKWSISLKELLLFYYPYFSACPNLPSIKTTSMDFFNSIRQGNVAGLQAMVQNDPSLVSKPDARGFTPLIMATYSEQIPVTQFLLKSGADVNQQDASGNTALMGISFKGHQQIIQLLLDHGADINLQNYNGSTALIFATTFGQIATVKALLAAGADPSLQDAEGKTALAHAKEKGNVELVALLENL